ncbi:cytochrome c class I [Paenibacillus curdlanolyticus YK9]|uniref:Cytochrome c class I n=1 Tax=Paenibacillus curdlanolyticus YK9 TaxID=717606 RepID=E0I7H7_9BACL|nr:cytochrome c [Paenibacillus curdlanolyticus]EFM11993.1 cytochrome c class I [Paenibacillus curdlanolyticus YK9]
MINAGKAQRSKNAYLLSAIGAVIIALSGCGSSSNKASALDGPSSTVDLYNTSCISCHASDLSGKVGPESDLRSVGKRMSKDQIANQITNGGDIMPSFKNKLSAAEIAALSEWLAARQ